MPFDSERAMEMHGARKAAVLLLSLEQSLAASVLRKLSREHVELVTLAIATAEGVSREEQEHVLAEFKSDFTSRPLIHPAGPETARELLENSIDLNDVESLEQRIEEHSLAGAFAFLHNRHADDIRGLIENESPQTIALISAQLPPDLAAQVLGSFPPDRQAEVLERLARIGPSEATVLDEIAAILKARLGTNPIRPRSIDHAMNVLRETPYSASQSTLKSMDRSNPSLADSLRNSLFCFHDIEAFSEVDLRFVLEKTDQCQWAVALKGTSESLRQRVLSSLSEPFSKALSSEMNSIGPLRLSDITTAQSQIVNAIQTLENENEFEIPPRASQTRRTRPLIRQQEVKHTFQR